MRLDADDTGTDPAMLDRLATVLSELGGSDSERVDPPDWLWSRIAASVAAEREQLSAGSDTVVEYRIDSDDVVIAVTEDWAAFATDNGAPELAELGSARTLWSYFDRDEVRDLWRHLVEQVRARQVEAHVPLRCDAAHARRWFEMTITPEPDGVVRFRSVLVFEESRPAVSLLGGPSTPDGNQPAVPVCSWCGDGHDGARWRRIEDVVRDLRLLEDRLPSVDYGICPTCRSRMSADLFAPATRSSET